MLKSQIAVNRLLVIATSLLVATTATAVPAPSIVTNELQEALRTNNVANIFVTMKENTSQVLKTIKHTLFENRDARLNALHSALVSHAQRTQEPILRFLSEQSQTFTVKSFWISNQIYIKTASPSLVSQLEEKFSHLITSIDEEFFAHLIEPVEVKTNVTLNDENRWGVQKIQAPEAWQHLGGLDRAGEGVIVATTDTGVRVTHEALRNNFAGAYGWWDPSSRTRTPTDSNGHGTHTTGTIAGGMGIGVAPKATWCACRGCASAFCSQPDLLGCAEFFTCPTHSDGSNQDCSKAPHLVSNSWGGGRGNTWYNPAIEAYHAAGIIPVFSIGNNGPSCNTANSPGDQNVIGVGSSTDTDAISSFSSVGPTTDGRMKPDIVAPGSAIISAYHTSDTAYASLSGSSMAAPHAAGTIALLHTRNKNINYDQARNFLRGHADQQLSFSGRVCDGVGDNQFPNHVFGNGRINALKSVRAQTATL